MIIKLQQASDSAGQSVPSGHTDVDLVHYAKDVLMSGSTLYEASVADGSVHGGYGAASSNVRTAQWVGTVESPERIEHTSDASEGPSHATTLFTGDGRNSSATKDSSVEQKAPREREDLPGPEDYESDDDFNVDFFEAAMQAGGQAFDKQDWAEANSQLQDSLALLQHLSSRRRSASDIFPLHYKLAVCAYHTQEPGLAEKALRNIIEQLPDTDEQRRAVCEALHLLSQVYIRLGKLDLARKSCESALKGRQRLFGKAHDSYLMSLALMSRIYELLDMPARAKVPLSLIPESRRSEMLAATTPPWVPETSSEICTSPVERGASPVGQAAGGGCIDDRRTSSQDWESNLPIEPVNTAQLITSSPVHTQSSPELIGRIAALQLRPVNRSASDQVIHSQKSRSSGAQAPYQANAPLSPSTDSTAGPALREGQSPPNRASPSGDLLRHDATVPAQVARSRVSGAKPPRPRPLDAATRRRWLDKLKLKPITPLERLICQGQLYAAMSSIATPNKLAVRLRVAVAEARPTALHYAALFGDVELGRVLLAHGFVTNSKAYISYNYGFLLLPIHFALGARRVSMCKMLLQHEAKCRNVPCESLWTEKDFPLYNDRGSTLYLEDDWLEATSCEDPQEIIHMMQCLERFGWGELGIRGSESPRVLNLVVSLPDKWKSLRRPIVSSMLEKGTRVVTPPLEPYQFDNVPPDTKNRTTALIKAIRNDAADVIPLLPQQNGEEQLRAPCRRIYKDGQVCQDRTPLYVAVLRALEISTSSLDTVRALLEGGANVHDDNFEYIYKLRWIHDPRLDRTVKTTAMKLAQDHVPQRQDLLVLLQQYDRQPTSDQQMPAGGTDKPAGVTQAVSI